ncbi:DUF4231 domain-containing protein [Pseudanabaena sp. Chao 1811]|uniref:DUF4231 domain-containing protein n=1 Tax=Pseudanabaena sp. Chao 1811 TaxID=2963092 RepID=UPI0022F38D3B|nr:DUF4231 domain-containing protein [Pseudanabaena sp. Chao 1811]
MEAIPESNPLNRSLLEDAWRLFCVYDRTAVVTQRRFLNFRIAILVVGVISTILVIIRSAWDKHLIGLIGLDKPEFSQIFNILSNGFYWLVIIAPITVSVLLAASVKLDRGMNWIILRASAEILKKEIYCYRTLSIYEPKDADMRLAESIQVVSDRLMKTQVNRSGLALDSGLEIGSKELLKAIKNNVCREDTETFSPLTVEQYLGYRLIDQLSWYRRKTVKLDRQWQLLQWSIYVWGGLGTFLAAVQAEIWIAITNAIATAIASFLDFKQLDTTMMAYNQAACNLENLLCWWHALTDEARANPDNIKKLVNSTEKVIQSETSSWVEEMREALSELYKEKEEAESKKN